MSKQKWFRRYHGKRAQNLVLWKRCLDCKKPNTVIRGSASQQFRTGGQFHCSACGGTNLDPARPLTWKP